MTLTNGQFLVSNIIFVKKEKLASGYTTFISFFTNIYFSSNKLFNLLFRFTPSPLSERVSLFY